MSNKIRLPIESADITERLVGITPVHLNNFVQRGTFGLQASVQAGELRAKRRLFSADDVYGIALVWLLFEAGLRTDPIIRILKDIVGRKEANANLAAKKLLDSKADWLLVIRKPRGPAKDSPDKPEQVVKPVQQSELPEIISQHAGEDVLLIPVGSKFQDIQRRMEILF